MVKLRDLLLLAGGVAAATQASALSLGNTRGSVQLGHPMDLVFQVQPDAGHTADSSCIRAEVWMGDTALDRDHITLTPQAQAVRVRTTTPVYEPLITVKLHAGCEGAMARSYTFFADPPTTLAASVEPIDLNKIQSRALPVALPAAVRPSAPPKPRPAKRPVNPSAAAKATPPAATATTAAPASPPAAEAASATNNATPPAPQPAQVDTPPSTAPRLRVEPLEGIDAPAATTTTAAAAATLADTALSTPADTVAQTQLLLDANAARLEAMEKQLQALHTQLTHNRTEISSLQTQLVQAQNQGLPLWVHLMLGMLALALATIAWLLQRLRQTRQQAQPTWADTVLAVGDTASATTIDTQAPAPTPATSPAAHSNAVKSDIASPLPQSVPAAVTAPALPSADAPVPRWSSSEAPTPTLMPDELYAEFEKLSAPPRPSPSTAIAAEVLTAQALFDVQEQAEFYASIGENDQAIAILQAHIAEHEASSPLAYIELLQLLYRLARTDAFDQVREKFQTHFNVKVPDFLGFARKGHDLWSGYHDVLGQIESLWPTDDVQALLRSLMVRAPAAAHADPDLRFDLSAFDDLLMLYNVAQTTPAASRGQLPGRMRTAPSEPPLPEILIAPVLPTSATQPPPAQPASAPLALHEAHLEMLSAAPAEAPLAPPTPLPDSPFQSTTHFAPSEALMSELSLDWSSSTGGTAGVPTPPGHSQMPDTFHMDERDLPKPPKAP